MAGINQLRTLQAWRSLCHFAMNINGIMINPYGTAVVFHAINEFWFSKMQAIFCVI